MRMVDPDGHALGRRYYCAKHEKALEPDEIVRGYETENGEMIVVTDEELDDIAPEMTREIELRRFVPLEQIAPKYFDHPYIVAPAGRSTKAYHLLAKAIDQSGRIGIGTFVMRSRQYLVAVLSDGRVLRAQTLRFASEFRATKDLPFPKAARASTASTRRWAKLVDEHTRSELDHDELSDRYAEKLQKFAEDKLRAKRDVIRLADDAEHDDEELPRDNVIDLMKILRDRLGRTQPESRSRKAGRPRKGAKRKRKGAAVRTGARKTAKTAKTARR